MCRRRNGCESSGSAARFHGCGFASASWRSPTCRRHSRSPASSAGSSTSCRRRSSCRGARCDLPPSPTCRTGRTGCSSRSPERRATPPISFRSPPDGWSKSAPRSRSRGAAAYRIGCVSCASRGPSRAAGDGSGDWSSQKNPPGQSRAENSSPALGRNDRHDLERIRVDDQDLVADDDELEAAKLRNDLHDFGRQRYQPDVPRNHGSDRDREVHAVDARTRLLHDDAVDLRPLLLRELNRGRRRARSRPGGRTLAGALGLSLRARLLLAGGRLTGLSAALLLGHAGLLALLRLRALRLLASLGRALGLALGALLLGALLLALGHAGLGALLLGALLRAFLFGALLLGGSTLLSRTLALAHLARTGAGAALGLAGLCTCEGRACNQRCRRSRDPQCGLHAQFSFPLWNTPCLGVCRRNPIGAPFVPNFTMGNPRI